jgi:hypothetical protein
MPKRRDFLSKQQIQDQGSGRWLVASYFPVSLFSLRTTHATSKGGKTLLVPTPSAVKMALLDACFRRYDAANAETRARSVFDLLKSREVRFRPPRHCIVQNTFVKVLDWDRDKTSGPFRNTIAYREFAFFGGDELQIALGVSGLSADEEYVLGELFAHINSLGKRGSFWQFKDLHVIDGELPFGFTVPRSQVKFEEAATYLMTQLLDDFGADLCTARDGFDRVSTYGNGDIKLGVHRVLTPTAIPYGRRTSSRHFTQYERTERQGNSRLLRAPSIRE